MDDIKERAPPEKEAAALVGNPEQRRHLDNSSGANITTAERSAEAASTFDLDKYQLMQLATDVAPHGNLRRYVPLWPFWCRRIGTDVLQSFVMKSGPDPTEIPLLLDAHARATAKRNEERETAEQGLRPEAQLRRSMRRAR
jgi:hypothetical protein